MKYLFICSVGPVQDFIATARRSRDLWYGSWMLSELSKAVARSLGKENLIFPSKETDINIGSKPSLSNKVLALVECEHPEEVGEKAHEAAKNQLVALRDEAFSHIHGELDSKTLAEEQVDDLLEFYWSAVPLKDENDYPRTRAKAEALLSARKATRNFVQKEGNHHAKSSLDGKRESVIPEEKYPKANAGKEEIKSKTKVLYREYGARHGERLSGVDLMKRLGKPSEKSLIPKFHSTSHYASLPFRDMLVRTLGDNVPKKMLKEMGDAYEDFIGGDIPKDDGSLFYASRVSDFIPDSEKQEEVKGKIEKIYQGYGIKERPSPYYALLRADGDNMGKVIDNQKSIENHQKLSKKLSDFAKGVPEIVKNYDGDVIYAGGDDILAYLPLHTTLDCISALDTAYQNAMNDFKTRDGEKTTLSAALLIAHHLTPLSDVMELSRSAEGRAKEVPNKNGLLILASKRSGEDREIRGKMGELQARFKKLIDFHRSNAIGKGTAYELQKLYLDLKEIDTEALEAEAIRIIKRKHESGSREKIDKKILEQFKEWIKQQLPLSLLAKEMIIASLFASALDMAEGKSTKQEKNS